jgi:hypothetical protein
VWLRGSFGKSWRTLLLQQFPEPSEMAAPPVAKTLETPGHMLLPNWLSGI